MPLSMTDRVLSGLACAYAAYRVVTAVKSGVYDDEDGEVHADRHPGAFALTGITGGIVALLLAVVTVLPKLPGG